MNPGSAHVPAARHHRLPLVVACVLATWLMVGCANPDRQSSPQIAVTPSCGQVAQRYIADINKLDRTVSEEAASLSPAAAKRFRKNPLRVKPGDDIEFDGSPAFKRTFDRLAAITRGMDDAARSAGCSRSEMRDELLARADELNQASFLGQSVLFQLAQPERR